MRLTEKMLKLLEREMDAKTAFKILGLEYGDYDGVDKAYKKLAMINHPDRGGDMEKMKEINQAKDAVGGKKGSVGDSQRSYDDYRAKSAERDAEKKKANDELLAKFDAKITPILESYTNYFETVTGNRHTVKIKKSNHTFFTYGAVLTAQWKSDDKSSFFELEFSLAGKADKPTLGGDSVKEFTAQYEAYMFIGTKKYKLTSKRWETVNFDADEFKNPEKVFPKAKIKKSAATNTEKPLKRIDVFKYMQVNFDARSSGGDRNGEWLYIPINGEWGKAEYALVLFRMTSMRRGMWYVKGLGGQTGSQPNIHYNMGSVNAIRSRKYHSMIETRGFLNALKEIVKLAGQCAKVKNLDALDKYIEDNKQSWYEAET